MFCRMAEALCTYIEKDRPFLGICLGLQLLFESSEENGPGQSYLNLCEVFIYSFFGSAEHTSNLEVHGNVNEMQ